MKKIISIIIATLLIVSFIPTDIVYAGHDKSEYLDIKIGKDFNSLEYLTLLSKDGFYLYDKLDKSRELFQIIDESIIISLNNNKNLDILDLQYNIIKSIPGDGSIIIGSGSINDSIVQVDKNSYRDFISFIVRDDKTILINHINIEKYLYGVVPREVGASFPMESIKAQAVAARTFAMANKNKHRTEGFDLCDTTHCQVYGGASAEHPTTSKAVNETRNIYVYYDGNFADTTFHSNNGGYIESSKDVWGGHMDYLIAKEDPFSANTTNSTWDFQLTSEELNSKIFSGGINIGDILDIEILEKTEANRVTKLKLKGTLGEEIISGAKLRTMLGNTTMKSTWFNVLKEGEDSNNRNNSVYVFDINNSKLVSINLEEATIVDGSNIRTRGGNKVSRAAGSIKTMNLNNTQDSSPKGFKFEGRGFGHGVGMSQYGAAEMAKQGYSYEEILKHYYHGVDILYKGR